MILLAFAQDLKNGQKLFYRVIGVILLKFLGFCPKIEKKERHIFLHTYILFKNHKNMYVIFFSLLHFPIFGQNYTYIMINQ